MIFGSLLCKLPSWLGGGHRWRRLTVKERMAHPITTGYFMRRCRNCPAERVVKARKPKVKTEQETTT